MPTTLVQGDDLILEPQGRLLVHVDGAAVTYTQADGVTPLAIFADEAGTIPVTQPLTSIYGRVEPVGGGDWWHAPTIRVRHATHPDGRVLAPLQQEAYSAVDSGRLTSVETGTVLRPIHPAYGAVGDGVADDSTAVENTFTAAGIIGGTVLIDRPYKITRALTGLADNVMVEFTSDGLLDFSTAPLGTICLSSTGVEAAAVSLAANAVKGATSVNANAHGLAVGDYFKIGSTATYDPGRTDQPIGEQGRVKTVTDANNVVLESPLRGGPYNTADTATIAKITHRRKPTLRGPGEIRGGGTGSQHVGFRADKALSPLVDGKLRFINCEDQAISFYDCIDAWADDPVVDGSNYSGRGYGVFHAWACQGGGVRYGHFTNVRHAHTVGGGGSRKGLCRGITRFKLKVRRTIGDAIDTHAGAEDISTLWCDVYDSDASGINHECPSGQIIGNTIERCAANGIAFHNETPVEIRATITQNETRTTAQKGVSVTAGVTAGAAGPGHLKVCDNVSVDSTLAAIYVVSTATWRFVNTHVDRNTAINCADVSAIQFQKATGGSFCDNSASEGASTPTNQSAIRPADLLRTPIRGNTAAFLSTGSKRGINGTSVVSCPITGNTADTANIGFALDDASSGCTVSDNIPTNCTVTFQLGAGAGHRVGKNGGAAEMQTLATNAIFTLTPWTSPERTLHTGTLTANRVVTLSTTRAVQGQRFKITRTGGNTGGPWTLDVTGAALLKGLATGQWATFEYDGAAWFVSEFGSV